MLTGAGKVASATGGGYHVGLQGPSRNILLLWCGILHVWQLTMGDLAGRFYDPSFRAVGIEYRYTRHRNVTTPPYVVLGILLSIQARAHPLPSLQPTAPELCRACS